MTIITGSPSPGHRPRVTVSGSPDHRVTLPGSPSPGHYHQITITGSPSPGHRHRVTVTGSPSPGHRHRVSVTGSPGIRRRVTGSNLGPGRRPYCTGCHSDSRVVVQRACTVTVSQLPAASHTTTDLSRAERMRRAQPNPGLVFNGLSDPHQIWLVKSGSHMIYVPI